VRKSSQDILNYIHFHMDSMSLSLGLLFEYKCLVKLFTSFLLGQEGVCFLLVYYLRSLSPFRLIYTL
jgi:hypothetical protein